MLQPLIPVISAFVISLLLTPIVRKIAIRFKVYASPNHRTVHEEHKPKLGGLAMYVAFATGLLLYSWLEGDFRPALGLLAGGSVALFVGFLDDVHGLNCYVKLSGQTLAALVAVQFGFVFDKIYFPLGFIWEPGMLAVPLTVLWIVAVINAFNLLDGLDGLAAGFAILLGIFLISGALIHQHIHTAVFTGVLIAAAGGFLKHNFHPAKIFMGDSGSLFLGFSFAVLALRGYTVPGQGVHASVLIVLFFVPLMDTVIAIIRRVSQGLHPFTADRKHVHHRFLKLGLSHRLAVFALYGIALSCGMTSLILLVVHVYGALLILLMFVTIATIGLYLLGCFNFRDKEPPCIEEPVEKGSALLT